MLRPIDLTFKPYPAPVGNGDAVVRPNLGYRPGAPVVYEPVSEKRSLAEVLSFYKISMAMSGVQPGEIFQKSMLTSKPYTTYATYYNPNKKDDWEGNYLAELPANHLTGKVTTIDLTRIKSDSAITREQLQSVIDESTITDIVFLRTDYSKNRPVRPEPEYFTKSPTLTTEAAEWLATLDINVLGADVRTLDPRYAGKGKADIYGILNKAGIVVVEDLINLELIDDDHSYVFIGIPLPIQFALGGPARVFAVDLDNPQSFIDCSHVMDMYPQDIPKGDYPFNLPETKAGINDIGDYPNPWPGRIEPREDQGISQRSTRLTPFELVDESGNKIGREIYIEHGHGTGTHIEGAFFDPWGRHAVPEEILKRYIRMPADRLVANACLLDLSEQVGPLQQIDYMHLENADPGLQKGDICVIRADVTDWYFYGASPGKTPGLSPDAARWLVDKGIRALVLDFAVEKSDPVSTSPAIKYTPNKIHYFLHKNDIPIVEWCVNMKNLRKKKFVMAICAMPASHQGGFPAQVFAVEKW